MSRPSLEQLKRLNAGRRAKLTTRDLRDGWTYALRWWDGRHNRRQGLNTQILSAAIGGRDEQENELRKELLYRKGIAEELRLSEFTNRYLDYCRSRQLSRGTVSTASWVLKALQNRTGDVPIERITPHLLEDYIAAQLDRGRKPRGVVDDFRVFRAAFNWAVKGHYLKVNPANEVKPPRVPRQVPRRFTPDQFRRVMEQIDREDDRAIALTLILTGMRRAEVLGLRWSDIDLDSGNILIRGKGGNEREIPVGEMLRVILDSIRSVSSGQDLVFPGYRKQGDGYVVRGAKSPSIIGKRFRGYLRVVGLDGHGTFHRFRHTTASALADMGYTELDIAVYLGHTTRTVTQGYIQIGSARIRELAGAMGGWVKSALRP